CSRRTGPHPARSGSAGSTRCRPRRRSRPRSRRTCGGAASASSGRRRPTPRCRRWATSTTTWPSASWSSDGSGRRTEVPDRRGTDALAFETSPSSSRGGLGMDAVSTERIRDVALLGHGGVGKTTLVEALLLRAGVIGRMGRVEDGTTTCDTEPEAQRRCMSLGTAVAPFDWTVDGVTHRVNLIDTPGHDDFVAAATSALDVVDLAVLVVSATDGVEPGTERAWAACEAAGVPRLVFVTKEDKQNADFHAVLDQLRDRFGAAVHALEL